MQAITALAHLDACVVYFLDISELCGYSIADQLKLFSSIKPLFKNKPLVLVLNKIDIRKFEDLSNEERKSIEDTTRDNNAVLIQMSNTQGDGVADVKAKACEILLEYRFTNKTTGKADKPKEQVMNRIYVAFPKPRDDKLRVPHIPENLKNKQSNFTFNEETLERKIVNNRVREEMEKNGGSSVYYVHDRAHFMLEDDEWKNDIMPEIMDGKNIFDFVDPEIDAKLAKLEDEEDRILEKLYQDKAFENQGGEEEELDDDLIEAHEKMMINKEKIRKQHKLVTASQLPKKVRGLTETEELMQKIRWDKGELGTQFLSQKSKRQDLINKRKQSTNSLKNSMVKSEKDELTEYGMDLDDEDYANKVKILEGKKKDDAQKKLVVERISRKIQKKLSRVCKIDHSDRRINSKLPKHLNSGHRGIGKTDYR